MTEQHTTEQTENPFEIPKKVKIILLILALFMPVFLIIPLLVFM